MLVIGLIKEAKIPADNRVALIPSQCRWLHRNTKIKIVIQSCETRCYKDSEYLQAGVEVLDDNIAVGFKYLLIESYNLCFISSFSTITSITKSAVFIKNPIFITRHICYADCNYRHCEVLCFVY